MSSTESRPQSWSQILSSEINLSVYSYEDVPTGNRSVVLEVSVWHRSQSAVICCFRDLESGQRYRISVFRDHTTAEYGPEGVNFARMAPGTSLHLRIHQNRTGTFRIVGASLHHLT